MNWQDSDLSHIIKENNYDEQLLIISKNFMRFDELDNAIDWAMARAHRKLDEFFEVKANTYIYRTDRTINFPLLVVLFEYDESKNTITVLSVTAE